MTLQPPIKKEPQRFTSGPFIYQMNLRENLFYLHRFGNHRPGRRNSN